MRAPRHTSHTHTYSAKCANASACVSTKCCFKRCRLVATYAQLGAMHAGFNSGTRTRVPSNKAISELMWKWFVCAAAVFITVFIYFF